MMMLRGIFGTVSELVALLWIRRRWWLIPAVLVLLFFGIVIALGGVAGVGPFIYTLF
jgi:Family of unknown function (DUF5989)